MYESKVVEDALREHNTTAVLSRLCRCKVKKNRWTLEWRWRTSTKRHKALVEVYSATRAPRVFKVGKVNWVYGL